MRTSEQYYRVEPVRRPALPAADEVALFADYRSHPTAEKCDRIVRQYLYWASEIACRYCTNRITKADAISAANLGLMEAISRFDPSLGRRFVTFSYFVIRGRVIDATRASYTVNPDPGLDAAKYRWSISPRGPEDVERRTRARDRVFARLNATVPVAGPVGAGSARTTPLSGQLTSALSAPDRRPELERLSLLDALRRSLPGLPRIQQRIVTLRYLTGDRTRSFVAIARTVRCTPKKTRRLHAAAIAALQISLQPIASEL